jgi:small conductance mechanosensitive channel
MVIKHLRQIKSIVKSGFLRRKYWLSDIILFIGARQLPQLMRLIVQELSRLALSGGGKFFPPSRDLCSSHGSHAVLEPHLIDMQPSANKLWEAVRHLIDGFIDRLPALVLAICIFFVFYGASRLVARAIQQAVSKHRQNLALLFARLTGGATILLGLMVSISIVAPSFQVSDLIKILGIGGVAIGFAFQNILQNFLAGLLLLWSQPFRVGDEIKIDAYKGTVEEIQTRATTVKTYDGRQVVIPNSDLFTHAVIVNTALGGRRWQYDLDIKKVSSLQHIRETIESAVRRVPGVLSDPEPETLVVEATPDTIKMRILWSTRDSRQHQMLGSYDKVLTDVVKALDAIESGAKQKSAA